MLVEDGIRLHKYWFSVSDSEQQRRFESRLTDPMRRWKLSTTDIQSIERWEDYSRAKDDMMVHTDIAEARWNVVESDDKRRSRINMIADLLSKIPYEDVEEPTLVLPERPPSKGYVRPARSLQHEVPDYAATLPPAGGLSAEPAARTGGTGARRTSAVPALLADVVLGQALGQLLVAAVLAVERAGAVRQ